MQKPFTLVIDYTNGMTEELSFDTREEAEQHAWRLELVNEIETLTIQENECGE